MNANRWLLLLAPRVWAFRRTVCALHTILCIYVCICAAVLLVMTDSCCKVRTPQSAAYLHAKYRFHISPAVRIFRFSVWPCSTCRRRRKQRYTAVTIIPSRLRKWGDFGACAKHRFPTMILIFINAGLLVHAAVYDTKHIVISPFPLSYFIRLWLHTNRIKELKLIQLQSVTIVH